MQLFKIDTDAGVSINEEIKHIRFRDVPVNNFPGKERDIEDLLIQYPGLLNFGDFDINDHSNNDLLIISRQPVTSMKKRADLLGIHRDGSLAVIEVKRDAIDERNRIEGIEFQAIRYAAASRKMTSETIIDIYARYLYALNNIENTPLLLSTFNYWRDLAVDNLCEHLSDEEQDLSEDDLLWKIDPKTMQKIYLVAADYEADVISACAWLREHDIDISCFRLRPFHISSQFILQRERLIPPPELDDFMTDTFASPSAIPQAKIIRKPPSDKPSKLIWTDDGEKQIDVATWRGMFEQVIRRALVAGLTADELPVRASSEEDFERERFQAPIFIESHKVWVDLHASARDIQKHVTKILKRINKEGTLRVETQNGDMFEF